MEITLRCDAVNTTLRWIPRACQSWHIFEAAKENMTDGQLEDGRKITTGVEQPLRIPGGKNMACPQL